MDQWLALRCLVHHKQNPIPLCLGEHRVTLKAQAQRVQIQGWDDVWEAEGKAGLKIGFG